MFKEREINTHRVAGQDHSQGIDIVALDEKGQGNANHKYQIRMSDYYGHTKDEELLADINFQNGPVKEFDINGISNESLLAIVIDRLQGFQSGEFSSRDNAVALAHLETALLWLHKRTLDRIARGVEGRNVK
jgi:hypothetical protein